MKQEQPFNQIKAEPPVLYLYIQGIMEKYTKGNKELSEKDARMLLHHYRIPKHLRSIVLKEMSHFNLLVYNSRLSVRLVNCHLNKFLENPAEASMKYLGEPK